MNKTGVIHKACYNYNRKTTTINTIKIIKGIIINDVFMFYF